MSRWLIERAGVKITVHAKSEAAERLVLAAIEGLRPRKVTTGSGVRLQIGGEPGEWRLNDKESHIKRHLNNDGDLIYHLTDRMVFHIANNAADRHCLHAASVAHDGNALVIPANSGAGKSSFTTWLVAKGFAYITDELIMVDEHDQIDGLARPIQIKSHGLDAIAHLLGDDDAVFTGNLANALPIKSLHGVTTEQDAHPLKLVIYPQYVKDGDFSFTRLSSADAGMRLMANHVNARNLEGHGFRAMMKLIRSTPCYELEYGGFARLPDDFVGQLQSLLSD